MCTDIWMLCIYYSEFLCVLMQANIGFFQLKVTFLGELYDMPMINSKYINLIVLIKHVKA